MRREKIDLRHKEDLYNLFRDIKIPVSEYSFANLYLFRDVHDYHVIFDREIFISGLTYDGEEYLMPTKDVHNIDFSYLKEMMRDFDSLFPVPSNWLKIFNTDEFEYTYKDGDTDYLYTIEKIGTYKGKKMHKKRNLLKQFENLYNYEAHPLNEERLKDAEVILKNWLDEKDLSPNDTDYKPCLEAIEKCEELILCGGIYYVEGEPAGFVLGEELNEEVYALHFVKALTKFKGIYQFIYNNFAKILPEKYHCLNFEQDLGQETLRHAKASYRPDKLLKKYRVRLRK